MKKITTFVLILLKVLLINQAIAQNLIAVQNGGGPKFLTNLQEAVNIAQSGDTIYMPGGSFGDLTINKQLHFIGVGFNPDSTLATNRTVLSGINLQKGADSGSISGCYIIGGCTINEFIDQYSIRRCYLSLGINFLAGAWHFLIAENIIHGFGPGCLYGGSHSIVLGGTFHTVANNIILNDIVSSGGNLFKNNLILYSTGWCGALNCNNDEFQNNIIFNAGSGFSSCIGKNNLGAFVNDIDNRNNQGINNFSLNTSDIFVSPYESCWSDLHLKPDSPYKNAGTDGTDIGIYGGVYPWKEGSIPSNPHFQSIQIATKTDTNGNFNVKIKVAAQIH